MIRLLAAPLLLALLTGSALAQSPPSGGGSQSEAASFTVQQRHAVLDRLETTLDNYVFPDKAAQAKAVLKQNRARYAAMVDREAFASALTDDLMVALDDKHFYVRGKAASARGPAGGRGAFGAATGYGVATVRRLPGNIGYLELPLLSPVDEAAPRLNAAMDILQDTDALIIDLRNNRGGGGAALDTLIGRLAAKPIPRSALLWRRPDGGFDRMQPENTTFPPEKLYGKPVYVLTSNVTISAGEGFSYDLQQAGRAVVVGETTRGGASPMNRPAWDIGEGFVTWVSNGDAEHPVTKTSPRRTGVKPDVPTRPADALIEAYRRALDSVRPTDPASPVAQELAKAKADPMAALTGAGPS